MPVSVKDLVDVKGVPTRHGSAIFEGNPPAAADDILVKRLRAAGAILVGKTTTPEFGHKPLTEGPLSAPRSIPGVAIEPRAARAAAAPRRRSQGSGRWRSAPTARARSVDRRQVGASSG